MDFKIINDKKETLGLFGNFSIQENFYPLNLTLKTKDFSIVPFSKIGKNVITDFEGLFNSEITITGNSKNPNFLWKYSNN